MKDARRAGTRAMTRAMQTLPGPMVRRMVSMWAPLARYGGASRGGAAALSRAMAVLAEPPVSVRSRERALPLADVAARLGRTEEELERWARLGLLGEPEQPDSAETPTLWSAQAVERARLIDYLRHHDVSEDEVVEADQQHRLPLLVIDQAVSEPATLTREEVARRAGVDPEFAARIWRALGLPPGEPGEPLFGRRDVEAMRILAAMRTLFTDDDLVEASSVLGLGMAQVAGSQIELFRRRVTAARPDRADNLDYVLRNAAIVDLMLPTAGLLVDLAWRRHIEAAVRGESVAAVEEAEGALPGQVELLVGFADLVGFTAASERLQPLDVGEMAGALVRRAEEALPGHGARIVKTLGDAVMFTAPDAPSGAAAALDLMEAAGQDAVLPQLRIGLAHGPVLRRYGDVFGRTVNVASRLTGGASPGAVLFHCDTAVDPAAWAERGVATGKPVKLKLKGIEGGLEALPVVRA